jgi:hypothetical protein
MADIQADGLRAASDLLERMLASNLDGPETSRQSPARDYVALVDAWAQVLQRIAAGLAAAPVASGAVTIPVDSSVGGPPVRVVLERPERAQSTTAEIWLHNGTSSSVGPLVLCCGALTAAGGDVLDARVGFDPDAILVLPPRSSRGVVFSITASGRPDPGIYRGTIQADGAPMLWLPVEVAVEPC